jgi:aldehyde dehydrogenase (NAD+)
MHASIDQIVAQQASVLAAGRTMMLKPNELAPLSPILLAEILDAAEVPHDVFILINGVSSAVGASLSNHPNIDLISFTADAFSRLGLREPGARAADAPARAPHHD